MDNIESESRFVWKFLLQILLTPITLILVLFKKKRSKELYVPFKNLLTFIFEPKFTITIIIITIITSVYCLLFISDAAFNQLINYPSDLLDASRWFSLITSGFLHANLTHLFGNMLAILIFGRVVERKLGFSKTAMIYFGALLISSIGDSIIGLIVGSTSGSLGSSGAIMGLVAAAMLIDPLYLTYELILPLPIMVVGWITMYADILGILDSSSDGIAHFAHLFGYLSITLMIFFLNTEERSKMKKGLMINLFSLLTLAALYLFLL
jgi:membrane associated rhomboid family serine protease